MGNNSLLPKQLPAGNTFLVRFLMGYKDRFKFPDKDYSLFGCLDCFVRISIQW